MSEQASTPRRFLVALSFPGEKREFVEGVAEILADKLGREQVFYDFWYEHELSRANLDIYLQEIYGEQSELVVPFFGEDYDKKPWCCKVEWPAIRAALTFEGRGDQFLMAMRFDGAPIKGFLKIHGYVAIGDRPAAEIANLILKRLEDMGLYGSGGTPDGKDRFLDCVHNLPSTSIGDLLRGRDPALETLSKKQGQAAISQAIQGMGGVGKTRLAIELGWKAVESGDFKSVLFVIADSPEALQSNLADLAVRPLGMMKREEMTDVPATYERVLHHLESTDDWFLILDNVDTEEAAQAVRENLPRLTRGRLLATTRQHGLIGLEPVPLGKLNTEESAQYLLDAANERTPNEDRDEEDAKTLAANLDGLPLALEQAKSYINYRRGTFSEYLEDWEERRERVLSWDKGMDDSLLPVAMTYDRSVDLLAPLSKAILRLCAFLSPEPIPMFLFEGEKADARLEKAIELLKEEDGFSETTSEIEAPRDAIGELANLSFIDREPEGFSVHRMVQESVRIKIPEGARRDWIDCALNLINNATPIGAEDPRTWSIYDAIKSHAMEVTRLADNMTIPEPTARLMAQIGIYLGAKDNHGQAEPLIRRALKIDERTYGASHPLVASHLNNLAGNLRAMNRLRESESLIRRAMEIDIQVFGKDHHSVARDLSNLAIALQGTNRPLEAETLVRQALEIIRATYGEDHPEVAIYLNNLAKSLEMQNRLVEAENLVREGLKIRESAYDHNHPELARSLNQLAWLLLRMNRLADAEVLMRRALSIDEISFPGGHPIVARDLTNLAGLLRDTGRPIEAEPLMYRALDLLLQFTQNAGQSHPIIRDSLCNYRLLLSELDFTETEVRNRINSLIEGYGMKMEDLDIQEERNY